MSFISLCFCSLNALLRTDGNHLSTPRRHNLQPVPTTIILILQEIQHYGKLIRTSQVSYPYVQFGLYDGKGLQDLSDKVYQLSSLPLQTAPLGTRECRAQSLYFSTIRTITATALSRVTLAWSILYDKPCKRFARLTTCKENISESTISFRRQSLCSCSSSSFLSSFSFGSICTACIEYPPPECRLSLISKKSILRRKTPCNFGTNN